MLDREKKIYDLMKENRIFGDIIENNENMISIEICWGDWKHEHLRLDWMMQENFPDIKRLGNETTEEDGSDCYSAIHYYYF